MPPTRLIQKPPPQLQPLPETPEYHQAIRFLNDHTNYERVHNPPYSELAGRLGMVRAAICAICGSTAPFPIIHVAGTKGKGSTCSFIERILVESGYTVGHFVSPHLQHITERIVINGVPCSPAEFGAEFLSFQRKLLDWIKTQPDTLAVPPVVLSTNTTANISPHTTAEKSSEPAKMATSFTFFELLTLFAFVFFKRKKVDIAVFEVGLGGTYDATNICTPIMTVITSISYDHIAQLGPTLVDIATEKGGIIKPNIPNISGVTQSGPVDVIRQICEKRCTPLFEIGADFQCHHLPVLPIPIPPIPVQPISVQPECPQWRFDYTFHANSTTKTVPSDTAPHGSSPSLPVVSLSEIHSGLPGRHQVKNATLGITAAILLRQRGWNISDEAIHRGVAGNFVPARVEVVHHRPTVVIDGAHNKASVDALMDTIQEGFACRRKILIFGTTLAKDIEGMLLSVLPFFDKIIFTSYSANPRRFPPSALATISESLLLPDFSDVTRWSATMMVDENDTAVGFSTTNDVKFEVISDAKTAFDTVWTTLEPDDLLCVTGSFYLAAEIRHHFLEKY